MSNVDTAPLRTMRPTLMASLISASSTPASRAFSMWWWSHVGQFAVTAAPMAMSSVVFTSMIRFSEPDDDFQSGVAAPQRWIDHPNPFPLGSSMTMRHVPLGCLRTTSIL